MTRADLRPELARLDGRLFEVASTYLGVGRYEDQGFIPTESAIAEIREQVETVRRDVASAPVGSESSMFTNHLLEVCDWLAVSLDDDRDYPVNPLRAWIAALQRRMFPIEPNEEPESRSRFLRARLEHAPAYLDALAEGATSVPAQNLEPCARRLDLLGEDFVRARGEVADLPNGDVLLRLLETSARAVSETKSRLETLMEQPRETRLRCAHEDVALRKFGFDVHEIRAWLDDELDVVRGRVERHVQCAGAGDTVRSALAAAFAPYSNADALWSDAREALQRARAFADSLVSLPPGERLDLSEVPATDRDKLPYGAYSGGNVLRGNLEARWLINTGNLRGVHAGWIWMMAFHEGYPGHHVHYVKTAAAQDLPLTFRIPGYGPAQGLIEGLAHRSEGYLLALDDKPELALMVDVRQLQTLLRIETQLAMSVERVPTEVLEKTYVTMLGMDARTSAALVRSQSMNPGRTYSYFTGMRSLRELQRSVSVSDQVFTEAVFSSGFVSLRTIAGQVRGTRTDLQNAPVDRRINKQ